MNTNEKDLESCKRGCSNDHRHSYDGHYYVTIRIRCRNREKPEGPAVAVNSTTCVLANRTKPKQTKTIFYFRNRKRMTKERIIEIQKPQTDEREYRFVKVGK